MLEEKNGKRALEGIHEVVLPVYPSRLLSGSPFPASFKPLFSCLKIPHPYPTWRGSL
jgi:hypothetical protein